MSEINLENLSKKELIAIIKNIKEEHPEIKIKLLVDNNLDKKILDINKLDNKQNNTSTNYPVYDFSHINFII